MTALARLASRLGGLVFPPLCPGCGAEAGAPGAICPACWRDTRFVAGPRCESCGRPEPRLEAPVPGFRCDECSRQPPAWDRGRAVFLYRGAGRRMVLAFKHGDRLDMAPMLGDWLARAGAELIAEADLVVPVPLHWTRRLKRRFNQSAELARATLKAAGRPEIHAPDLVLRSRRTPSQEGRDRAGRAENLAGALRLARGAEARLAGRRVLLVDDVLTTGATLSAAARVLRTGGATGVDILVMAVVAGQETHYLGAESRTPETEEGRA